MSQTFANYDLGKTVRIITWGFFILGLSVLLLGVRIVLFNGSSHAVNSHIVAKFGLPAVTTESNTIVRVVLQFNSDGSVTWERQ